ncbi:hypothetical protein DPEC_G00378150 [Dallia pectoralis]|nr:hypothetical protein DPEC_G00378150 [Dallia pectoralis]
MIKRVMRNRDALHTTLSKQKHNLALPTNAEYEKLAKLEKLLEPCRAEREPVWAKLRELAKGEEPALQPLREESLEPPKKKTALLLMGSDSVEETPEDNTVERYKVEPSASLDQCPLKWWSEHTAVYGKMANIARKYLGTPATTVPCERLFSLAGHIVQKRRSSLSPENVNKLVCLNDWWKEK